MSQLVLSEDDNFTKDPANDSHSTLQDTILIGREDIYSSELFMHGVNLALLEIEKVAAARPATV